MEDGASTLRKDFIQGQGPNVIEVAEVVKGAGLKIRSQMGSWVRIPLPAPRFFTQNTNSKFTGNRK